MDQFIAKYNGKTKGYPNDSSYLGECLSIVKLYIKEVYGIDPPPSGTNSAYGYWSKFPSPLGTVFEKVSNTPTGVPQKGDIIIWNTSVGGGYGHIAIFVSGDANSFVSFDQNWGGKQAHMVSHNYNNVVGWLHPKGDEMIPQDKVNGNLFNYNGMIFWHIPDPETASRFFQDWGSSRPITDVIQPQIQIKEVIKEVEKIVEIPKEVKVEIIKEVERKLSDKDKQEIAVSWIKSLFIKIKEILWRR